MHSNLGRFCTSASHDSIVRARRGSSRSRVDLCGIRPSWCTRVHPPTSGLIGPARASYPVETSPEHQLLPSPGDAILAITTDEDSLCTWYASSSALAVVWTYLQADFVRRLVVGPNPSRWCRNLCHTRRECVHIFTNHRPIHRWTRKGQVASRH